MRNMLFFLCLLCAATSWAENDWEVMNPETPPDPRFGHAMARCDAQMLLMYAGKKADAFLAQDPIFVNNEWILRNPSGNVPPSRYDHVAWTIDGKMYVFGGNGPLRPYHDLWRYDLSTDTWEELPAGVIRPSPRYGHAVAVADDGRVFISGGTDMEGNKLNDLWVMNPDFSFNQLQSNIYHASNHKIHICGDKLLLFGRPGVVSTYSISEDKWTQEQVGPPLKGFFVTAEKKIDDLSSQNRQLVESTAEKVTDTRIFYFFGGIAADEKQSDAVYELHYPSLTLIKRPEPMPFPLFHAAGAVLKDDGDEFKVLIFGGISNGEVMQETLIFSADGDMADNTDDGNTQNQGDSGHNNSGGSCFIGSALR